MHSLNPAWSSFALRGGVVLALVVIPSLATSVAAIPDTRAQCSVDSASITGWDLDAETKALDLPAHGFAADSDDDGIPDYADACPIVNQARWQVGLQGNELRHWCICYVEMFEEMDEKRRLYAVQDHPALHHAAETLTELPVDQLVGGGLAKADIRRGRVLAHQALRRLSRGDHLGAQSSLSRLQADRHGTAINPSAVYAARAAGDSKLAETWRERMHSHNQKLLDTLHAGIDAQEPLTAASVYIIVRDVIVNLPEAAARFQSITGLAVAGRNDEFRKRLSGLYPLHPKLQHDLGSFLSHVLSDNVTHLILPELEWSQTRRESAIDCATASYGPDGVILPVESPLYRRPEQLRADEDAQGDAISDAARGLRPWGCSPLDTTTIEENQYRWLKERSCGIKTPPWEFLDDLLPFSVQVEEVGWGPDWQARKAREAQEEREEEARHLREFPLCYGGRLSAEGSEAVGGYQAATSNGHYAVHSEGVLAGSFELFARKQGTPYGPFQPKFLGVSTEVSVAWLYAGGTWFEHIGLGVTAAYATGRGYNLKTTTQAKPGALLAFYQRELSDGAVRIPLVVSNTLLTLDLGALAIRADDPSAFDSLENLVDAQAIATSIKRQIGPMVRLRVRPGETRVPKGFSLHYEAFAEGVWWDVATSAQVRGVAGLRVVWPSIALLTEIRSNHALLPQTPWILLPTLGGSKTQLGLSPDRYRDRNVYNALLFGGWCPYCEDAGEDDLHELGRDAWTVGPFVELGNAYGVERGFGERPSTSAGLMARSLRAGGTLGTSAIAFSNEGFNLWLAAGSTF